LSTAILLVSAVCVLGHTRSAFAQSTATEHAQPRGISARDVVDFFAGAAAGLGLHESGHLVLDYAFGADPGIQEVHAGFIPFFAITHHQVTPGKEFLISSAGFWVQEGGNEWLLARHPDLRHEHVAFVKGLFAFNVLTSVMYAGTAFVQHGPSERDTNGMALSAGVDEPVIGLTILAPALLDGARYYRPQSRTLKWVSRASKIGGALLAIKAAGR
jgi:hypothetical protein